MTVTEQFFSGIPKGELHIPDNYVALYKHGSKPVDWPEQVPSMDELVSELKAQAERIEKLEDAYFD